MMRNDPTADDRDTYDRELDDLRDAARDADLDVDRAWAESGPDSRRTNRARYAYDAAVVAYRDRLAVITGADLRGWEPSETDLRLPAVDLAARIRLTRYCGSHTDPEPGCALCESGADPWDADADAELAALR